MAPDKTTDSNSSGQNNRLKWLRTKNRLKELRTKQQSQMAVNKTTGSNGCGQKTESTGYKYTTAVSIIKTTSTDTQLQKSFGVLWF
jgi:hypothetical protein